MLSIYKNKSLIFLPSADIGLHNTLYRLKYIKESPFPLKNKKCISFQSYALYPDNKIVCSKKGIKNKRRKGRCENQRTGFIYEIIPVSTV